MWRNCINACPRPQERAGHNVPKTVGGGVSKGSALTKEAGMHARANKKSARVREAWTEEMREQQAVGLHPCPVPDPETGAPCSR